MDRKHLLDQFLLANKMQAQCINTIKNGSMQTFEIQIQNTFKLSKFFASSKELMLALKSLSIPRFNYNLNKGLLQVEIMTKSPEPHSLISSLEDASVTPDELAINIGHSFKGEKIKFDLSKNPHMLIGGSTGSGKSSLLHNIIANLLLHTTADLYLIDTKSIEFSMYNELTKRVKTLTIYEEYRNLLIYLISLMESRYNHLKKYGNINPIHNSIFRPIVLIIDEFADLSMQDEEQECYTLLCRLLQKCRAAGIYAIITTQRPSVDIITGAIKANLPARIACRVASKIDSRIILDHVGAESFTEAGEAIINNFKFELERFKFSYSPPNEIYSFLKKKLNETMAPKLSM